jgi:hypothetical protein
VPRVLIAGGDPAAAQQTAEIIDLSAATPAWSALCAKHFVKLRQAIIFHPLPELRPLASGLQKRDLLIDNDSMRFGQPQPPPFPMRTITMYRGATAV